MAVSGRTAQENMTMGIYIEGKVVEGMEYQGRDPHHDGMEVAGKEEKEQVQESTKNMKQRLVSSTD